MINSNKNAKAKTKKAERLCKNPWVYWIPHISPMAAKNTIRPALDKTAIGIADIKRIVFL
jgi:hypothetical protein